jgi:hypothetical protein
MTHGTMGIFPLGAKSHMCGLFMQKRVGRAIIL